MSQVLLVDSSCARCTRAGRMLAEAAPGRIEVESLHDAAVRAMLDREQPGWRMRPMLVTREGDRVRVRAGLAMCVALARAIGFTPALRVLRELSREPASLASASDAQGLSRRAVLARSGAAFMGLVLGSRVGLAAAVATPSASTVTDSATIERLKKNPAIAAAARSFGAPDWSSVLSVPAGDPKAACSAAFASYVLAHPQTAGVYTAVAAEGSAALSFEITEKDSRPAIRWMSTSGKPWALSTLSSSGRVVTAPAAPPVGTGAAEPDITKAFIRCFTACVGSCLTPACLQSCFECGSKLGFGSCAKCAACAGPSALTCVNICG